MINRMRQALRSYARSNEEFCEAAGLRYFETHWGLEAHEIRRLAACDAPMAQIRSVLTELVATGELESRTHKHTTRYYVKKEIHNDQ